MKEGRGGRGDLSYPTPVWIPDLSLNSIPVRVKNWVGFYCRHPLILCGIVPTPPSPTLFLQGFELAAGWQTPSYPYKLFNVIMKQHCGRKIATEGRGGGRVCHCWIAHPVGRDRVFFTLLSCLQLTTVSCRCIFQ